MSSKKPEQPQRAVLKRHEEMQSILLFKEEMVTNVRVYETTQQREMMPLIIEYA